MGVIISPKFRCCVMLAEMLVTHSHFAGLLLLAQICRSASLYKEQLTALEELLFPASRNWLFSNELKLLYLLEKAQLLLV